MPCITSDNLLDALGLEDSSIEKKEDIDSVLSALARIPHAALLAVITAARSDLAGYLKEDREEEATCATCGGHGGGPDRAHYCTSCNGRGAPRVVRERERYDD